MSSPTDGEQYAEQSDVQCADRLTKREMLPVADADGKVLGRIVIRKFVRQAGKAYNQIVLFVGEHPVAEICGFRLHSRVCCGDWEGNCPRIDSKDALLAARAALEHAADAEEMLLAIQEIAETLAAQRQTLAERRQPKKRRGRGGSGSV
jgi:hypothetical protein